MWWTNLIRNCLCVVFIFDQVVCLPYFYARDRNNVKRSTRKISPALLPFGIPFKDEEFAATKYMPESQHHENHFRSKPRMMGLNTGNDAADHEAGIWLMALIGVLAAAVPVAFLNPSLGFKKKRSAEEDPFNNVLNALDKYGSNAAI